MKFSAILLIRCCGGVAAAWRRETVRGSFEEYSERPPLIPLQNIHPLGLGEFAGAAEAVASGVVALGAGHRRSEPFFQPRLRRSDEGCAEFFKADGGVDAGAQGGAAHLQVAVEQGPAGRYHVPLAIAIWVMAWYIASDGAAA